MSNDIWKIFGLSGLVQLTSRRWWRQVRQCNPVHGFPVIGRHHLNCIPGTPIQERAVGSLANAFLTADAEIGINFNTTEWRVIFVGDPEHAGFDGTILDTRRRTRAAGATVGCYRQNPRSLLA